MSEKPQFASDADREGYNLAARMFVAGHQRDHARAICAKEIAAAEERGRRRGVEEERKRCEDEKACERNATIEILTAPRCKCGRFSMSGANRHGLLMLGGTCGRDVLHAPDRCDVVALAPRDPGKDG